MKAYDLGPFLFWLAILNQFKDTTYRQFMARSI